MLPLVHNRRRAVVALATLLLVLLAGGAGAAPADLAGHWEGAVTLPGLELGLLVDLQLQDGAWSGTADIPMQGAKGIPLAGVRAVGDSLVFALAGVPGEPTFRGVRGDGVITGDFTQQGRTFPFHLGRGKLAAPNRPQEPKPPLPYREEEVGYDNGPIHLAATLTLPEGTGPFPAAVLITGSGPQNRDEALLGHRPFLVLSDYLTRAGIAVLRADDRGVGGSTGKGRNSTTSDFADDALAGVRYLRTRPEVDRTRIGLIGHSEGGIVGPLAAARAPDEVAFVVMIAGTGVPLDEVILRQTELIERAGGAADSAVAAELGRTKLIMDLVKTGADSAAVRSALLRQIEAQLAALPDSARAAAGRPDALADAALAGMLNPWFRYAVGLDPRVALRRLRCPVLALNGTLDLQVDPDQNLPEIERALREGGDRDVTVRRLPGLNHLLQRAKTGHPDEYATIEETMNEAGLAAIRDWLLARFAGGR
ncbi:MAG: alpha/beta hydrolase family protein [Candidatus Krumholzibacteriia bacterium]